MSDPWVRETIDELRESQADTRERLGRVEGRFDNGLVAQLGDIKVRLTAVEAKMWMLMAVALTGAAGAVGALIALVVK